MGGVGPRSTETVAALYECITKKGVIKVKNATIAETAKIFEGIYRNVNMGLVNELAKLCQALSIDFMAVREATNSQPYCHLHLPGCGVGGICIPYYPYFALETAEKHGVKLQLTSIANLVNDEMPSYTVNLALQVLEKMSKRVDQAKIAVLGLAFRGNIADTRNSPAYEIIRVLKDTGARDIVAYDPHVKRDKKLAELGVQQAKTADQAIKGASLIIIVTDHDEFKQLNFYKIINKTRKPAGVVDGRNILDPAKIPNDIYYVGIGRVRNE